MNKILFIIAIQLFTLSVFSQSGTAYKIFNAKGKKVSYKKMLKCLTKKDFVFFGEIHNNSIAHWLQIEVTKDLNQKRNLILGAEMFEADNQKPLKDYLAGDIDETELDSLARLWSNYDTDYAPLVNFAKEKKLPFIATNIPRRYAKMVYRKGFEILDSLPQDEKNWIAPLPIPYDSELPTYKSILELMGDHGTPELVKAQAIKDATMAHFILKNYSPGNLFLHFNGSFHSDYKEGILWYLNKGRQDSEIATITTVSQENVKNLLKEHFGKADFIICVDSDMTSTY